MTRPLYRMACGHVNDSWNPDGTPACIMCGCSTAVKEVQEDEGLEGRTAVCPYCHRQKPSSWKLPFFQHQPDQPHDRYYCGCWGWD